MLKTRGTNPAEISIMMIAATSLVVFTFFLFPVTDNDIWFHLADGKYILENGRAPTQDIYSYTAAGGPAWTNSWGFAAASYLIYKIGGLNVLNFLKAVFSLFAFLVIAFYLHQKKLLNLFSLAFIVLAFFIMRPNFSLRPHTISFLIFVIFLILFLKYRETRNTKYIFELFLAQFFWVNLHATFIWGLGFTAIFVATEMILQRRLDKKNVVLAGAILLASLLNIFYGYHFLIKIISEFFGPTEYHIPIREFIRPTFASFVSFEGLLLLLPWLLVAFFYLKEKKFDLLLILLFITAVSLTASRFLRYLMLFLLLIAPFYFPKFPATKINLKMSKTALTSLYIFFLFILFLLAKNSPLGIGLGLERFTYPIGAVDFIKNEKLLETSNGNLYNTYNFGGYLIWNLYPEHKIFIDGRVEPYVKNSDVFQDYWANFEGGEVWAKTAEKYNITATLMTLPHIDANTLYNSSSIMFPKKDWALVYFDDTAMVYVKRISELQNVIEKDEYKILNPQEVDISYLGNLIKNEADFNDALKEIKRGLEINPDSYRLHFMAAYLYGLAGNEQKMREELNLVLKINPYFKSASNILNQL